MATNVPQVDVSMAIEMYDTKLNLSAKDIRLIFNCGSTKANELRKMAAEEMKNRNILQNNSHLIDTKIAYYAWNLDLARMREMERRGKLKKKG